jgi:hypothetical protein
MASKTLTQYQRQNLELRERELQYRISNPSGGRQRAPIKVGGVRDGVVGTVILDPNDPRRELAFEPAAPTAATRGTDEARSAAMVAYEGIRQLRKQLPTPKSWVEAGLTGLKREIGARTQADPVANRYKASIRGFVPLMARALRHVGVLTELDVERTEALFSGLGATAETDRIADEMMRGIMSGQIPFQFGGGGKPIGYMDENGEFTPMGSSGAVRQSPQEPALPGMAGSSAGPGEIRRFNGRDYRLKPGTDRRFRSNWEVIQ